MQNSHTKPIPLEFKPPQDNKLLKALTNPSQEKTSQQTPEQRIIKVYIKKAEVIYVLLVRIGTF